MIYDPRLTLAAVKGGCGKTTVCLGLIAAWRRQGRTIAPFKKGPDYIDAGWLAQAAGAPCHNLDPFLMSAEGILDSFARHACGSAAVIEGNRGLYDGANAQGTCSTAELAKLLASPVVLILDCTKVTRTLAAVVHGCRTFDPDLQMVGVILNQIATSRQEDVIRQAIEEGAGLPVLGAMPRIGRHEVPERHLGLVPHQEHPKAERALTVMADLARDHLDLDRLWKLAVAAPPLDASPLHREVAPAVGPEVTIGLIQDSVFQFYYPENIEALQRLGARIQVFSALDANRLPEVDALYLGGGFPETHAEVLAANQGLRDAIRDAARDGLPIYAECGGLMYLGRHLQVAGNTYPMAGVLPVTFGIESRPQGHGYAEALVDAPNPFFPQGSTIQGHEFHYSRPVDYDRSDIRLVLQVTRGHGFDQNRDGLSVGNVFATYIHQHAITSTAWAAALIRLAGEYARRRPARGAVHDQGTG